MHNFLRQEFTKRVDMYRLAINRQANNKERTFPFSLRQFFVPEKEEIFGKDKTATKNIHSTILSNELEELLLQFIPN